MGCGCGAKRAERLALESQSFTVKVEGEKDQTKGSEIEARAAVKRAERDGKVASWAPST